MQQFAHRFGVTGATKILDIGGSALNWSLIPIRPRLTVVNLLRPTKDDKELTWVVGDGRHLPFKNNQFDIAYSNSVIEHLSNSENQRTFAAEVARVAKLYYVQTPNRWFPIEPHLLAPVIHFFPKSLQKHLLRNFTIWGLVTRPSREKCREFLAEVRLLDRQHMRLFFPDAQLVSERFFGLPKSIIAMRNAIGRHRG